MKYSNKRYKNKSRNSMQSSQLKIIIVMVIVLLIVSVFVGIKLANNKNDTTGLDNTEITISSGQTIDNVEVVIPSPSSQIEISEKTTVEDEVTNDDAQKTNANDNEQQIDTTHISETINGSIINLTIDLDVTTYPNMRFGIYDASPVDIDVDECLEYVFTGIPKDELYYVYGEEYYKKKFGSTNNVLYYIDKNTGEVIMYDPNNEIFPFLYEIDDEQVDIDRPGHLLRRKQQYNKPDETMLSEAVDISNDFLMTIFKKEFTDNFVQIYSGLKKVAVDEYHTGAVPEVYLTVYQREIEGLPLLFDKRSVKMGYYTEPIIDEIEVWVNDGKVLLSYGAIRHVELREKTDIISAEEALSVLKRYFETIEAKGDYEINTFELMYYPTFTDDADTTDIYAKQVGAGYVKYIPAWVIASGERISDSDEYVMIIDATTGEVIKRRKG